MRSPSGSTPTTAGGHLFAEAHHVRHGQGDVHQVLRNGDLARSAAQLQPGIVPGQLEDDGLLADDRCLPALLAEAEVVDVEAGALLRVGGADAEGLELPRIPGHDLHLIPVGVLGQDVALIGPTGQDGGAVGLQARLGGRQVGLAELQRDGLVGDVEVRAELDPVPDLDVGVVAGKDEDGRLCPDPRRSPAALFEAEVLLVPLARPVAVAGCAGKRAGTRSLLSLSCALGERVRPPPESIRPPARQPPASPLPKACSRPAGCTRRPSRRRRRRSPRRRRRLAFRPRRPPAGDRRPRGASATGRSRRRGRSRWDAAHRRPERRRRARRRARHASAGRCRPGAGRACRTPGAARRSATRPTKGLAPPSSFKLFNRAMTSRGAMR